MADAAGELSAEHGRALAEFGTEALTTDLQEDACRTAELGQTNQLGDHLVPPLLVLLGSDEEQFRNLVDHQDQGRRSLMLGQPPHIRSDLLIRSAGSDALARLDQVVATFHLRHQLRQKYGRLSRT